MNIKKYLLLSCFLVFALQCVGCSSKEPSQKTNENSNKPLRDNTPTVLKPEALGKITIGNESIIFDLSNSAQGYVMVKYNGNKEKVKVRISNPKETTPYTYDLKEGYNVFPLTGESGQYTFAAYENIADSRYSTLFSEKYMVKLKNEYTAFLYPNEYVNYDENTKAIQTGKEIAAKTTSDLEVVEKVYKYVIENISYDDDKADLVKNGELNGYLPDVDKIFEAKKGICFDYAALVATMLRTQNIPTRMLIGYATMNDESFYHAWIGVYIKDIGWVDNIIEFNGNDWSFMDPTLASENNNNNTIKNFISNKDNYVVKFLY